MAISSIDDVLENVCNPTFKEKLVHNKNEHKQLEQELKKLLEENHNEGKEPNIIAKGMSWIETNMKLLMNDSDKTIADIMTDGCNMGIKSLHKYKNQYKTATKEAKDITNQLINIEQQLVEDMRMYL